MAKLILFLVLGAIALNAWRTWRLSRAAPPVRRDMDDVRHPPVGALIVIVATVVLLLAMFVLPRLIDRLP
ncbi:MAG TPA: hypothetical protein VE915_02490 [Actinomycetota bacterium]|nr:hypothetical protein [Actinomycetota bacterium]